MRVVCLAVAMIAWSSTAAASPYVSLDAGAAFRAGSYDWESPPHPGFAANDPTPVRFDASVYGIGALTHFALGAKLPRRFALAGELGAGFLGGGEDGIAHVGIAGIFLARAGARVEKAFERIGIFVRAAAGFEWMSFAAGGTAIGARDAVWTREPTRGPYASASVGLRGRHAGIVSRLDVGRATSAHAVYWPVTLSLGVDVTWN